MSSDFSKTMMHDDWLSECCKASAAGDLGPSWHELKTGGESVLMREGVCSKCNKKSNFVRKQ